MTQPTNMLLDWTQGELAEGLACYRRAEFFEAHEHWELVWLTLEEPEKSFLQSLIQTSAAFHHFHHGNHAGTLSLLTRALHRLDQCAPSFAGIAVEPLRNEMRTWLLGIDSGILPKAVPAIRTIGQQPDIP